MAKNKSAKVAATDELSLMTGTETIAIITGNQVISDNDRIDRVMELMKDTKQVEFTKESLHEIVKQVVEQPTDGNINGLINRMLFHSKVGIKKNRYYILN